MFLGIQKAIKIPKKFVITGVRYCGGRLYLNIWKRNWGSTGFNRFLTGTLSLSIFTTLNGLLNRIIIMGLLMLCIHVKVNIQPFLSWYCRRLCKEEKDRSEPVSAEIWPWDVSRVKKRRSKGTTEETEEFANFITVECSIAIINGTVYK